MKSKGKARYLQAMQQSTPKFLYETSWLPQIAQGVPVFGGSIPRPAHLIKLDFQYFKIWIK